MVHCGLPDKEAELSKHLPIAPADRISSDDMDHLFAGAVRVGCVLSFLCRDLMMVLTQCCDLQFNSSSTCFESKFPGTTAVSMPWFDFIPLLLGLI
jgi:hypothetical protein